jgi:hypothetical protein
LRGPASLSEVALVCMVRPPPEQVFGPEIPSQQESTRRSCVSVPWGSGQLDGARGRDCAASPRPALSGCGPFHGVLSRGGGLTTLVRNPPAPPPERMPVQRFPTELWSPPVRRQSTQAPATRSASPWATDQNTSICGRAGGTPAARTTHHHACPTHHACTRHTSPPRTHKHARPRPLCCRPPLGVPQDFHKSTRA